MSFPSSELLKRFKSEMPLVVSLPDPISGQPFSIDRDNILAALVIDTSNLTLESQTVAMLYGEMARVHAAFRLAKEQAAIELRQWKATKAEEGRKKLATPASKDDKGKPVKGKAPTIAEVEAYYRRLPDYQEQQRRAVQMEIITDLMADMKAAFRLKQQALSDLHSAYRGHANLSATEDRVAEMSEGVPQEVLESMQAAQRELLSWLEKNKK